MKILSKRMPLSIQKLEEPFWMPRDGSWDQHGDYFPDRCQYWHRVGHTSQYGEEGFGGSGPRRWPGFLGVSLEESPTVQGAIIDGEKPNSPAEQAGQTTRSRASGGKSVASVNQLQWHSQTRPVRVLVKSWRNGRNGLASLVGKGSSSSRSPGFAGTVESKPMNFRYHRPCGESW